MKKKKEKPVEEPVVTPLPTKNKNNRDFIGAFFLIFIGSLFLLNNLGILPWNAWLDVWRFWPALLVLVGLQLLLGKSIPAQIVMAVVTISFFLIIFLSILAGAGILKGTGLENWGPMRAVQVPSSEIIKQELRVGANDFQNIRERKLTIDNGIGKFVLQDDDSDNYFMLTAMTTEGESKSVLQSRKNGDALVLDIDVPGKGSGPVWLSGNTHYEYKGLLGQTQIPTDIHLDQGAGESVIELDTVPVRNFSLEVGAGSATVKLDNNAVPSSVDLDIGVGSIDFSVPEEIGLEVLYDVGIGDLKIENQKLGGDGTYRTQNYDQAERKIRITAKVGAGSITIHQ